MGNTLKLILATLLLLSIVSCGEPPGAIVNQPAPDFDTVDMDGNIWSLSDLKGKVVFVNFWATWCPPCREEMPSMERLYKQLPKDKFEMVALYNKDDKATVIDFTKRVGATFTILSDQSNIIGKRYGVTGLPETFIIDKQGVLREKYIGPAEWDSPELTQMIMKYINQ